MEYWEAEMKNQGFCMVMTSTQVDESAQHFYRKPMEYEHPLKTFVSMKI